LLVESDPWAVVAVSSLEDDRLAAHLLEYLALHTWAGKPFVVPQLLRSPYARSRLRALFVAPSGIAAGCAERVLLAALHDPRSSVRETALDLLGLVGCRAAVPALIQALQDPLPSTRLLAARALGHSSDPRAVQALLAALHGANERQSTQIFMALTRLGHIAVPALLEASRSHSTWMRWHSIRALTEIRDVRAFPVFINALQDSDHAVAWMAARGLVPSGRVCVEPILHMLTTAEMTPWLRETASYVLSAQCQHNSDLKAMLEPLLQEMHRSSYKDGSGYLALRALEQLDAGTLAGNVRCER
jgi:HEAT repeat protein